MSDDVVAELDRWLAVWPNHLAGSIDLAVVQRAHDEIVALREMRKAVLSTDRAEALEEAAHECDEEAKFASEGFRNGCETCAAAIRALKEKPA